MEHKLARLESRLKRCLGVFGVQNELTVILGIGEGLVDGHASMCAGSPVDHRLGVHIGNGGVGGGVPHANHALIVSAGFPGHKLEFGTHLIPHALGVLDIQIDHGALRSRAAQGVESIGLQLIQESLVVIAGDCRIISAAG